MKTKQTGGLCPACLLPIAFGVVGMGSVGYGLSKKSKSKLTKSKSKLTKSKSKSKKSGGGMIKNIKGGTPPKKTKRKSMKGRLTRHIEPTPSPPRSIYEWLFGRGPKPPTKPPTPPKPMSLSKKNSKEMKKDPNYNKLSKVIAREMKIPTSHGKFVYKQNSKEKQRHDTKTKNLYNALYQ